MTLPGLTSHGARMSAMQAPRWARWVSVTLLLAMRGGRMPVSACCQRLQALLTDQPATSLHATWELLLAHV